VALVLKDDTTVMDQVLIAKCVANLFLICRILLAIPSNLRGTVYSRPLPKKTKKRCATKLSGKEDFDRLFTGSNEVAVEHNPSSGKWSWNFVKEYVGERESADDDNLLCLDQVQLEQEEQKLMWMANAPIPSSGGRNKIRKFGA
jgi:hypothetical protein